MRLASRGGPSAAFRFVILRTIVAVRDSKDSRSPALLFPPAAWSAFITAVKAAWADFDECA